MRPGWFIPTWHNYGSYRLTFEGRVFQKIGLGLWREIYITPMTPERFYKYAGHYDDAKNGWRCGMLCRLEAAWLGVHYSPYNRRFCINVLPFVTIWITLRGGKVPHEYTH